MRDEFYGDKRDVVKWSVLIQLAELDHCQTILQVAYYQPSSWEKIQIDGRAYALPGAVLDHLRNIRNVRMLKSRIGIEVLNSPFSHRDRAKYTNDVLKKIANLHRRRSGRIIIFLDPDTGLASSDRAGPKHVSHDELQEIWHALKPSDLLVLYQHANRDRLWITKKRREFRKALNLKSGDCKLALGRQIAGDVAFLFSRRPDTDQTVEALG